MDLNVDVMGFVPIADAFEDKFGGGGRRAGEGYSLARFCGPGEVV